MTPGSFTMSTLRLPSLPDGKAMMLFLTSIHGFASLRYGVYVYRSK